LFIGSTDFSKAETDFYPYQSLSLFQSAKPALHEALIGYARRQSAGEWIRDPRGCMGGRADMLQLPSFPAKGKLPVASPFTMTKAFCFGAPTHWPDS
jgi:hypothetical protein